MPIPNRMEGQVSNDTAGAIESLAESLSDAISESFRFGGENCDVDMPSAIIELAYRTEQIAQAITPPAAPGKDAAGGTVTSLTEAVMGVTGGLVQIAEAIQELANAVAAVRTWERNGFDNSTPKKSEEYPDFTQRKRSC